LYHVGREIRMTDKSGGGRLREARGTAHYISSVADELAQLARRHDLEVLAYLLAMAKLEADELAKD